jgi:hypothetical protein
MHAWVTPQEVVALHGTFLTAASLVLHLVVTDTAEEAAPTWPGFPDLMWATAAWLVAGEGRGAGGAGGAFQAFSWTRALSSHAGNSLVSYLRNRLDSGEATPAAVADPTGGAWGVGPACKAA